MITKLILIRYSFCLTVALAAISCNKSSESASEGKTVSKSDSALAKDQDSIPDDDLTEDIKKVITTKYLQPADVKIMDSADRKFSYAQIDLNNDGKDEVFVSFFTPYFCGSGGCTLVLLDSELNIINHFTVTETPLYITPALKNGWKVIAVMSRGQWKFLNYENGKYPSNPSLLKDSKTEADPKSTVIFKDRTDSKIYNF